MQTASAADQLETFIGRFDPKHQALIHSARKSMRKRLPTANELVYDNYNFFVIGYCVGLSFYYGAALPDPHKLLLGNGKQNRFIRIESATTLAQPEVLELISAAVAQAETPLPESGRGKLIIRSISEKQKPRRRVQKS